MNGTQLSPINAGAALLATLCAVLWGGLAVAIRFTQEDLPPIGTAGLRFLIASLVLLAWAKSQGQPIAIRQGQWPAVVIVGLVLFVQIGLFHWGLTRTNSAHGSVLIGSHPVFVALIAHFALSGDRLNRNKSLGLAVSVLGLVLVVNGGALSGSTNSEESDPATLLGDAVVLLSSFLLAAKTVYSKHVLARVEVTKLILWSNAFATAGFLVWSWQVEGWDAYHFTPQAALGLAYQGLVVAGFCFLVYNSLLQRHPASQLAVFTFAQPLAGIGLGVVMRGDPLTPGLIVGGLAVALGIVLVTRARVKTAG